MAFGAIRKIFGEIGFKDKASASLDKVNQKMDESYQSMRNLIDSAGAIGTLYFVRGFGNFAGEAIRAAAAFEQTTVAFEVMIGDANRTQQLLEGITQFSLETPFTPTALERNARMMLNFGRSAESIIPSLRMLGDISGGNEQKMNALTLAFSQVSSQGRLQGQDLLQMINAGFNPLLVISERTGRSMRQLREEMSRGRITFDMVQDAMRWATEEGGRYHGMMERQSRTWDGLMSTMKGFAGEFMKKIGQIYMKTLKPVLEFLVRVTRGLVEFFTKSERGSAILEIAVVALSAAVGVLAVVAVKALIAAFIALNIVTLPWLLIAAAIVAAIVAIYLVVEDLIVGFQGGKSLIFEFFYDLKRWPLEAWNWIKKWFWKIVNFIIEKWTQMKNWFAQHGREVTAVMFPFTAVVLYWEEIETFLGTIPDRIYEIFRGLRGRIRNLMAGMLPDRLLRFMERMGVIEPTTGPELPEPRAAGGPVSPGRAYVVGEDGPEILTMGSAGGNITPNGGMGNRISIRSLVGTINIYAQNTAEAATEFQEAIMDALNNLSENTLAAELGVNLS